MRKWQETNEPFGFRALKYAIGPHSSVVVGVMGLVGLASWTGAAAKGRAAPMVCAPSPVLPGTHLPGQPRVS